MLIVIINGKGGCGKDSLIRYAINFFGDDHKIWNKSSIEPIKEIAKNSGCWNGGKSDLDRKLLSDLKTAFTEYCDLPNTYLLECVSEAEQNDVDIMFVHIREGSEIEKFKKTVPNRHIVKTMLVHREVHEGKLYGNPADDLVEKYDYDCVFENDEPLELSGKRFVQAIQDIKKTKMVFDSLNFEVTRKCNMSCQHCLRGEAQNKDISPLVIDNALENVEGIGTIVFSGGEPSLNVWAIEYILEQVKKRNIPVSSFFVMTNGKEVTNRFLSACLDWYCYCADCNGDLELCALSLSTDQFHEKISQQNAFKLKCLRFFQPAYGNVDFPKTGVLNLGRAKTLSGINKTDFTYENVEDFGQRISLHRNQAFIENPVTITVNGDILNECDYAYEDEEKIKLGSVFDECWIQQYIGGTNENDSD